MTSKDNLPGLGGKDGTEEVQCARPGCENVFERPVVKHGRNQAFCKDPD